MKSEKSKNSLNHEDFPIRIIIAGGRDFAINNPEAPVHLQKYDMNVVAKAYRTLNRLSGKLTLGRPLKDTLLVIQGEARGADTVGKRWASSLGLEIAPFPADWDTHGKAAGYIRNAEMAKLGTHLIVFWDGKSKGTKNMIDTARREGVKVAMIRY